MPKELEFEYEGNRYLIEPNGTVCVWRTSAYMPNDPPTWYRCNDLTIWKPITQKLFELLGN